MSALNSSLSVRKCAQPAQGIHTAVLQLPWSLLMSLVLRWSTAPRLSMLS